MSSLEDHLYNRWKESMREYSRTKSAESKRAAKAYASAHTVEVTGRMKGKIVDVQA